MDKQKQNTAIAESMGIRILSTPRGLPCGAPAPKGCAYSHTLKDYTSDLNACAEFEDTMTDEQLDAYHDHLKNIVWRDAVTPSDNHAFKATAAQRCESYLRTINKWATN